jgi:succinyl-diaminopimelate desuccinylase
MTRNHNSGYSRINTIKYRIYFTKDGSHLMNTPSNETLVLCQQLIRQKSITPHDAGCQNLIKDFLQDLNFNFIDLTKNAVSNLLALRIIDPNKPLLLFVGHTDVVPTGDEKLWAHPPFAAKIVGETLFGRGAADMKSSIAAFLTATKNAILNQQIAINLGLAITSDEEGPAIDGCKHIADYLQQNNIKVDYCLVGEPSSDKQLGDTIRVGRRGSLHARLEIHGKQGHIAYPEKACNPIHKSLRALQALTENIWDNGNEEFPATSMQISNINAGLGAKNVIPESIIIDINFRFCPESSIESLKSATHNILDQHNINYTTDWSTGAMPFHSKAGALRKAVTQSIQNVLGITCAANTAGGTSDGRFFASECTEIIEFGLINASIHQIDEQINIADLHKLHTIYKAILQTMSAQPDLK